MISKVHVVMECDGRVSCYSQRGYPSGQASFSSILFTLLTGITNTGIRGYWG